MKTWRGRLSRREALLVGAALLLPIPVFAQSGLSVPLPGVVERGLGSLVTLEATDEQSGTKATGHVSENGRNDRRSGRASLRIVRGGRVPTVLNDGQTGADNGSTESGKPAGDGGGTGNTPAGGQPEGDGGGGGGAGSPGNPKSPRTSAVGSGTGSVNQSGVTVTAAGQGAGTGASAVTDGLGIDVGADNGGAGSGEPGSVSVDVTNEDGSNTGAGGTLPGVGVLGP